MSRAKLFFFKKDQYVRFDIATDAVDFGPAPISQFWKLPPLFQTNIGAVLNGGNGKIYFFKGDQYVRLDIATDLVDVGPAPIKQFWHLPSSFQSDINAGVNGGNGKYYLFKKDQYVRYDIVTDMVDVGPAPIKQFWNLPVSFQADFDAVVNGGTGKLYFFKKDQYVRFNLETNLVDVGPVAIKKFWNLPALFTSDIGDAVLYALTNLPPYPVVFDTQQGPFRRFAAPASHTNTKDRPLFRNAASDLIVYQGPGTFGVQSIHPAVEKPLAALMAALIGQGHAIGDASMKAANVASAYRPPALSEGVAYLSALKKTIAQNPTIFGTRVFPAKLEAMAQSELGFFGSLAHNQFRDAVGASSGWTPSLAKQLVQITSNFKAPRGGSPHHSGVVVDINFPYALSATNIKSHDMLRERNADAARSAAGIWLRQNAQLYGFDSYDTTSEIWHQEWREWRGTAAAPH